MKQIAFYLLLLVSFCTYGQTVAEKLDAYFIAAENAGTFNGSVLVVEKDRVLIKKGYGYQDVESKALADAQSIYQIGSITKQFTSAIILKLAEQGKLKLEDKLSKYFPKFSHADKITLENLLTHTSGLYNHLKDTAMKDRTINRDLFFVSMSDKPLDFEPGTRFSYSNTGYMVLGYIIEKVTGKPYSQVVRETILTPLKMNDTGLDFKNLKNSHKTVGYNFIADGRGSKAVLADSTTTFSAGAIYSTLDDLDKWNRALETEKIVKRASLKNAFTPRLARYGLGWRMDTIASQPTIGHTGLVPGFKSYNILLPETKTRIILLSNTSSFNEAKTAKDVVAILSNQAYELPKKAAEVNVPEDVLQRYVGNYQFSEALSISVRVDKGQLKAKATGQPELELFAKTEKAFFLKTADIQLEFVTNAQGHIEKLILTQGGRPRTGLKVN